MFSEQFFDLLLNYGDDWKVDDVKVDFKLNEVDVFMSFIGEKGECPDTMELCSIYDHRVTRRWRHLDTMQFKTFINCRVPRVKSSLGTKTISVPWADNYERHTYLFERLTIDLLKATKNQTQTAKLLDCGFNVVNRIIHLSAYSPRISRSLVLSCIFYALMLKVFSDSRTIVLKHIHMVL